jgi:methyl-accepting chemotaxis protein
MAELTDSERIDRLERVVHVIAEGQLAHTESQANLEKLVADLATSTRIAFDQVAEQFRETDRRMAETDRRMAETDRRMAETDRRMAETDRRMRETDERFRRTDERIDKLVVAIGELIRQKSV